MDVVRSERLVQNFDAGLDDVAGPEGIQEAQVARPV